jgi:hypothetical protein
MIGRSSGTEDLRRQTSNDGSARIHLSRGWLEEAVYVTVFVELINISQVGNGKLKARADRKIYAAVGNGRTAQRAPLRWHLVFELIFFK